MFCLPCKLIVQVVLLPRSNTTTLVTGGLADDVLDDEAAIVASFLHYSNLSTVVYKKVFLFLFLLLRRGISFVAHVCRPFFLREGRERKKTTAALSVAFSVSFERGDPHPCASQPVFFSSYSLFLFIMAWFYGHVITAFQLALELVYWNSKRWVQIARAKWMNRMPPRIQGNLNIYENLKLCPISRRVGKFIV